MPGPSLMSTLLFFLPVFAAPPYSPPPSPAHPSGPPTISSLGTLQVLKYNNLGPENNGTAAVLLYDRLTNSKAQGQCAAIGESLYPLQNAPQSNRTELQYQLDYLIFNRDMEENDLLWVSSSPQGCLAYSYSHDDIVHVPCNAQLPALCTSNVPPTTDQNRTPVSSSKISVAFDEYTLTGYRDARSFRFLGIPFANPPVKNLRFAPPQPYSGPKNLIATEFSDSCIQSVSSYGTLGNGGISEDCLYLNVYTPVLPANVNHNSVRKPVAVYFYGGSFVQGTTTMIDYDGGNFASRSDVVVVTVNYRLGALGYLSTGKLTTGNYGIRDQILALQWVNKYIGAFGGDPSQITIFGQSAGGQSVVALLSSSAARGLFHGAVVQSAPLDLPWFTRDVYVDLVTPDIAQVVGCNSNQTESALLSCLRSVPALSYLDNSTEFETALEAISLNLAKNYLHVTPLLASIEPFMPVIDELGSGVIDDQFYKLLAHNSLPNRVPTMFTTVADEAALYVDGYVPDLGASSTALDGIFELAYPSSLVTSLISSNAFPVNASDPDSARNVAADAVTHSEWSCPLAYLLANGGSTSLPTLYELQIIHGHIQSILEVPAICSPNADYNATCHSSDVLPVWGTLNSKTLYVDPYYNQNDILHSQLLHDIFASFFRSRNPNPNPSLLRLRGPAYATTYNIFGQERYSIPQYTREERTLNLLGLPPTTIQNPEMTAKCAVFEKYGFTFEHANLTV